MAAVDELVSGPLSGHLVVMGVDANTHSATTNPFYESVDAFAGFLRARGLVSIWGSEPDPSRYTTCSARTFLQTQLNKATRFEDRNSVRHRNLKDWILTYASHTLEIAEVRRDNTGAGRFAPDSVFPSLEFPSDHAIVSAQYHLRLAASARSNLTDREVQELMRDLCPGSESPLPSRSDSSCVSATDTQDCDASQSRARLFAKKRRGELTRKAQLDANCSERTLYDHWGLSTPLVTGVLKRPMASFALKEKEVESGALFNLIRTEMDGLSLEGEMTQICEEFFKDSSANSGRNYLDEKHRIFSVSEDRSIWILFSASPFSAAMCKRWAQFIMLFAACFFLFDTAMNLLSGIVLSSYECTQIRFSALQLRNGLAKNLDGPSIAAFGPILNGCSIWREHNTSVSASSLIISFPSPVIFNGWYITTLNQTLDLDPIHFSIDYSTDGVSWVSIESAPWLSLNSLDAIADEREIKKIVDLRPPVAWWLQWCAGHFSFSVCCFVSLAWALAGNGRAATKSIAWGHLGYACTLLGAAIYSSMNGEASFVSWGLCIAVALTSTTLWFERYVIDSYPLAYLLFCGLLLSDILGGRIQRSKYAYAEIGLVMPVVWTIAPSTLGFGFGFARLMIRKWVFERFVSRDRKGFNDVWKDVVCTDHDHEILKRIGHILGNIYPTLKCMKPRQYNSSITYATNLGTHKVGPSKSKSSYLRLSFQKVSFNSVNEPHPVESLDQLYRQAAGVNVFFKRKLQKIASGYPAASCVSDYCIDNNYAQTAGVTQDMNPISFSPEQLKPTERALEKLLRSYNGDVSRLLDCCRQRLVCETLKDLLYCLECVLADDEIVLLRIKNMLDVRFDTTASAGFRCVPFVMNDTAM